MTEAIHWQNAVTYVIEPYSSPWFSDIATGADLGGILTLENATDQWQIHERLSQSHDNARSCLTVTEGRSIVSQLFFRSIGSFGQFTQDSLPALIVCNQPAVALKRMVAQKRQFFQSLGMACELDVMEVTMSIACRTESVSSLNETIDVDDALRERIQQGETQGIYESNEQEVDTVVLFDPSVVTRVSAGRRLCLIWNGHKFTKVFAKESVPEFDGILA